MDSWLLAALAVPLGVALGLALGWLAWGCGRYSVDGAAERTSRAWRRSLDAVLAGETPAAIEELTRLLQSQPDTVETYLGLGTLFRVAGDPHRAARIHKTVTVREALGEPMRREARLAVGLDLQAGGHRDEAIANLEALVSNASDLAPAWRALAELYEADGRHAKAYEALARHGKLTGRTDTRNLARLKIAEGESLVAEGQRSGARKAFAKAASIAPHDARGHVALARYHLNDGARAKAANASLAAVEAEPDGAAIAWRALGEAWFDLFDGDRLSKALERAAAHFERAPAVLGVLARLEASRGDTQAALALIDEADERAGDRYGAALRITRAEVLLLAQRSDEALDALRSLRTMLD